MSGLGNGLGFALSLAALGVGLGLRGRGDGGSGPPPTPYLRSPVPYQKIVVGEPFSYSLADHFLGANSYSLSPGSAALPAGVTLSDSGDLAAPAAAVPMMNRTITVRASNTMTGLHTDASVLVSVAQRPIDLGKPSLARVDPNTVRVTLPALPANTPAITEIDILFGSSPGVTPATGTVFLNVYLAGATHKDIPAPEGKHTYVKLRGRALWGDGTSLAPVAGYSPNMADLPASNPTVLPFFTRQPSLGGSSFVVGDTITLDFGEAGSGVTYAIEHLTLNSVSIAPEVSGLTWNSAGKSAGAISFQVRATNAGGSQLSDTITATLAATVVWNIAGGDQSVSISSMPTAATLAAPVASGGANSITITG